MAVAKGSAEAGPWLAPLDLLKSSFLELPQFASAFRRDPLAPVAD